MADIIRGLEETLAKAYQENDVATLKRLLSDDYLVTDGPGTTSDKRKVLDDHASKRLRVTQFHFDELNVRTIARAAISTGQYTWTRPMTGILSQAPSVTCAPMPGATRDGGSSRAK